MNRDAEGSDRIMRKALSAIDRQTLAEKAARLASLPVELFSGATDEVLIEAARDKSPEEEAAAERLRDWDSEDWSEANGHINPRRQSQIGKQTAPSNDNLAAILEFLAKTAPARLERYASNPGAMAHSLTAYLPETPPVDLTPGSEEAAEAAEQEAVYLADAVLAWRTLTPQAQSALLCTLTSVAGRAVALRLKECLHLAH